MKPNISAFVISYNGEVTIRACLKSLSFADEIILIDKSSQDGTILRATGLCDRIEVVPWSPTVEETRQQALDLCRFDWVAFLDDDEILNSEAADKLQNIAAQGEPSICAVPRKEYILGHHSPDAYYWPNWQVRFFHRSLMSFSGRVHEGHRIRGEVFKLPVETGARIEHLSHRDVATWIEKTNRYTSQADRVQFSDGSEGLVDFAREAIERRSPKSSGPGDRSYESAVGVLMAVYEIVDALKTWEMQHGKVGSFQELADRLESTAPAKPRATKLTRTKSRNPSNVQRCLALIGRG